MSTPKPLAKEAMSPPAARFDRIRSLLSFKKLRLPSRNWLIFLGITSSLLGAYSYDRRECRRIRQEYIDRVKHLADQPAGTMEWPRKVTVYGSKWPGDDDYDKSIKYFRKYVKPILVAAAVDYDVVNGKRHGMLANLIAGKIKAQRRLAAGLDQPRQWFMPIPTYRSPEETRLHELEGGSIILGRQTFKEFMVGLKRGWTESLEKVDKEEILSHELQNDGVFDEPEELVEDADEHRQEIAAPSLPMVPSPFYHPLPTLHSFPNRPSPSEPSTPSSVNRPPTHIPPQPPILLLPFTDHLGFKQIPYMLWDFFHQRLKVRDGAEAAYSLIMKCTRPLKGPDLFSTPFNDNGDLDFDAKAESYYKKDVYSTISNVEKARETFYKDLPAKLKVARDLSRRVREPTKDELNDPPPTEVELQAERLKKELGWRDDIEGWEIVRPEAEVTWDERFRDALSVFVNPPPNTDLS